MYGIKAILKLVKIIKQITFKHCFFLKKEFTPKKEDKHNQSSKNRVLSSKFRSIICCIFTSVWKNIQFLLYTSYL